MNPGVEALERLVEMGLFAKGRPHESAALQYWPCGRPTPRQWVNASGLVHRAASFTGTRGLSVTRGRQADDVVYHYNEREDA
jgi:hypothetical protein